ncbi:hypothetical protein ACIHCQ_41930 [Streptomyces sp. NPDC052236]|uniref:hypothetical protein n=1 Tax=Streptomyces sp. NPDC052236 TaxID=3365686 RepID=UPI0037D31C29
MIRMTFSVRPGQGEPSGFDLGDIFCEGDLGQAGSTGHTPDQGMMIYPSVTLLLDGLRPLLRDREKVVKFVGIDTSFALIFRRDRKGIISVSTKSEMLGRVSRGELAQTIFQSAQKLAVSNLSQLPEEDAVRLDYLAALNDFRMLAEGTASPPYNG